MAILKTCTACNLRNSGICGTLSLGTPQARAAPTLATARAHTLLARPGPTTRVGILCSGFAAMLQYLPDGRRQILMLCRPGQFLLGCSALESAAGYTSVALTEATVAHVERAHILEAMGQSMAVLERVAQALSKAYDEVAQLAVDLGQRTAHQRLCHLFCNLVAWSDARVSDNTCIVRLPLRQEDIADYLGLTTAHVSRTISALRRRNLVSVDGDRLHIKDLAALRAQVG